MSSHHNDELHYIFIINVYSINIPQKSENFSFCPGEIGIHLKNIVTMGEVNWKQLQ